MGNELKHPDPILFSLRPILIRVTGIQWFEPCDGSPDMVCGEAFYGAKRGYFHSISNYDLDHLWRIDNRLLFECGFVAGEPIKVEDDIHTFDPEEFCGRIAAAMRRARRT